MLASQIEQVQEQSQDRFAVLVTPVINCPWRVSRYSTMKSELYLLLPQVNNKSCFWIAVFLFLTFLSFLSSTTSKLEVEFISTWENDAANN